MGYTVTSTASTTTEAALTLSAHRKPPGKGSFKIYQDLRSLVYDKAKPIMSSIRSFDFCTPRCELFREGEGVGGGRRDPHRPKNHGPTKVPPPHFKERWELRFERLRGLHLRNIRDDCGALELALFPACPNLDTLRPSGSMATSLAVDLESYSSVKYLIITENPTGGYYTYRAIGAIAGRFANLESLMIDFDLAPSERAAVHRIIQEQCLSLKQLALTPWNPFADLKSQARSYFAAMPKLELLQWSNDFLFRDPSHNRMARRTEQAIADSSSLPGDDTADDDTTDDDTTDDDTTDDDTTDGETVKDVFNMRLIHSSHALARFQHRPGRGGNNGAEGWDRKYEFSDKLRWPIGED
ncbi:hypothetical protein CPLU01_05039 [Colletotrichum plurivorum]|uniref:Uncharacterized protein n=1 Tax=Colletotrichum plurivorum TaxID=2175906 RepID=A0A8H6NIM6_9PEZI|nr:hypothetical protein CPLU01_05039 [Colletotrichum plurivorum]